MKIIALAFLFLASCTAEVSAPPAPLHVATVSAPDKPLAPESWVSTSCVPAGYHNDGKNEAWIDLTQGTNALAAQITATLNQQGEGVNPNTSRELAATDLTYDATNHRVFAACGFTAIQEVVFHLPAGVSATPSWPPGTTIVEQQNSLFDRNDYVEGSRVGRYWSRYHLVTLPSGGQLITLTQSRDTGDEPWAFGRAPHLIWHAYVDGRTVIAAGHVANMSIRKSRQHEHYGVADWILHELGLGEGLIKIGELSRKLRVRTRVETDGYEY